MINGKGLIRPMMKAWLGLFLFFLAVLGLAWAQMNPISLWMSTANSGSGPGPGEPPLPPAGNGPINESEVILIQGDIKYTVAVDRNALKSGEALHVDVSLTNTGTETVVLLRSYPEFRVAVYSQKVDPHVSETLRSLVWSSDYGRVYPAVATQVQLKPGDSMGEAFEWDLMSNDGIPVTPGAYYLYANAPQSPAMGPILVTVTVS